MTYIFVVNLVEIKNHPTPVHVFNRTTMIPEDPSERYLHQSHLLVGETPERLYLLDKPNHLLIASWKAGRADEYDLERFQANAMQLVSLVSEIKPRNIMVDCRHLGFEFSEQDIRWYIQQTKNLWTKSSVKRMAFVFKANLTVQMSMEAIKDVAQEEGIGGYEYRIFESNIEAANWLKATSAK